MLGLSFFHRLLKGINCLTICILLLLTQQEGYVTLVWIIKYLRSYQIRASAQTINILQYFISIKYFFDISHKQITGYQCKSSVHEMFAVIARCPAFYTFCWNLYRNLRHAWLILFRPININSLLNTDVLIVYMQTE